MEEQAERLRCADRALEALRRAAAGGYRDAARLRSEPDLALLREREDFQGLLAEYCRHRGISAIVKGLRSSSDFDYELPMATMNRQLSGVETVFLPAEAHYLHLSSTLIKEIFLLGGDVSDFVPKSVLKRLLAGESER